MNNIREMIFKLLAVLSASCLLSTQKSAWVSDQWISLFNGKDFNGWESYLGPAYDTVAHDFKSNRFGLNNDPDSVFTVVQNGGENIIRISGQHFCCLATMQEFENYHLRLQFRWGKQKYAPRKSSKRDSGVLYHSHGHLMESVGFFGWLLMNSRYKKMIAVIIGPYSRTWRQTWS
ncbi:MAG: DUF1080 domain-containing protein [Sphingobacteriales bacterium]|nr:DUF1080 domain-containing protein [Sphingobacteriales bacterium]